MKTQIDHLVVAAHTLEQGVQWCEATLGITPEAGGEHSQFGTHNKLFKIATPAHPLAYFEIIAINPGAKGPANPNAKRWFDLDNPELRAAVAQEPRLVHFVAGTDEMQARPHCPQGSSASTAARPCPPAAIRAKACCTGKSRCVKTATACLKAACPHSFNGVNRTTPSPCACTHATACRAAASAWTASR